VCGSVFYIKVSGSVFNLVKFKGSSLIAYLTADSVNFGSEKNDTLKNAEIFY
jgi:hypothetical protein